MSPATPIRAPALAAVALAAVALAAGAARADTPVDPRRRIAVLEFRSGSAELPEIERRLARILDRKTSLAVMNGAAARRSYPRSVDQAIAGCAGEAGCLAAIGRELGVAEILLVGVSELGDVILTLQRVDVARGRVVSRIAEALAPGAQPDDDAIERYLKRVLPESDFLRFGTIRIDSSLAGARVTLDDQPRGLTPLAPLRVQAPASYAIRLSKPGYVSFRATVAVPPDAEVRVRPVLARRPGDAWYRRWWVAALAGAVVIGATTAVVLTGRDEPGDVPVIIPPF
jgi:hypothetical protein